MGEPRSQKSYEYDDILKHWLGEFGRYQIVLYAVACLWCMPICFPIYTMVFASAVPNFHCVSPESHGNSTLCAVKKCCHNCSKYEFTGPFTSVVSEFNLICDRAHLGATANAMFMTGMLVGSGIFGTISDVWGRKKALFIGSALLVVFGLGASFSDCLSMFYLFRLCLGATSIGTYLVVFVYTMELVGPSKRTMAGKVQVLFWGVTQMTIIMLAYFIREWRYLMMTLALPGLIFLLLWKFFPESPRWLVANDRLDEAKELLMKYVRVNKVELEPEQLEAMIKEVRQKQVAKSQNNERFNVLHLVRRPKIRKRTIISCFNWFVNSLVYYGFLINVKNLSGNIYFNYFVFVLIEIPGVLLSWLMLQKLGRRFTYTSYMLIGGVACVSVAAIPDANRSSFLIFGLALVGKFFTFASFTSLYIITSELFPTIVRNIGLGMSSLCARIGGIVAPYIVLLGTRHGSPTMPLAVFGAFSLASGLISWLLPETLFAYMPQTLDEVETTPENYRLPFCGQKRPYKEDLITPCCPDDIVIDNEVPPKNAMVETNL